MKSDFAPLPALYVTAEAAQALGADAARLPQWLLSADQQAGLGLLLDGALFPQRGYPGADGGADGLSGLAVSGGFAATVAPGDDIALAVEDGRIVAVMSVTDRWGDGPVFLGGRVKGLAPLPGRDPAQTPNAMRARFHAAAATRVVAQLETGGVVLTPDRGAVERLRLAAPAPVQMIVARNHGATHLARPMDADAAFLAQADRIGLAPA